MRRRLAVGVALVIFIAAQWSPAPDGVPSLFAGADKLVHVGLYFLLAAAILWGHRITWIEAGATIILAYVAGLFMEVGQSQIPGRSPDSRDVLADVIGAALAVVTVSIQQAWVNRRLVATELDTSPDEPDEP